MEDPTIDKETGRKYDYYKILNISESEEDQNVIKKAYFKAAQKCHPDKNMDDLDRATALFLYVKEAYMTISDPQDRAYYNRNKNIILNQVEDDFDNIETFVNISALHRPVANFFATYSQAFQQLSDEEQKASLIRLELDQGLSKDEASRCTFRSKNPYPVFGNIESSKQEVSAFYQQWSQFQTVKLFQHCDYYTLKGENSRVRKIAGSENEKYRQKARNDFNQKVRDLVNFVKRRDERLLRFEAQDAENQRQKELSIQLQIEVQKRAKEEQISQLLQNKFERQRELEGKLRDGSVTQQELLEYESLTAGQKLDSAVLRVASELDRKEEKAKKEAQNIHALVQDKKMIKLGLQLNENGQFYCTLCKQKFQAVGQFKPHLDSKRHKKALKDAGEPPAGQAAGPAGGTQPELEDQSTTEENAYLRAQLELEQALNDDLQAEARPQPQQREKRQKARSVKGAKSDDAGGAGGSGEQFRCQICSQAFPSKNKLFEHIKKSGHAALKK